jgi:hypothetical protein
MAFDASDIISPEHSRSFARIAGHFDQLRDGWKGLRILSYRQWQHFRGLGLDFLPMRIVQF